VLCTEFACYTIKLTHVISSLCIPYLVCSLCLHLRASTTIYSQVCELQGTPMIFYFSEHSGALSPPCSPWSQQLGEHPSYAPTFCPHDVATSPTFYPMIPWSRKTMTANNPRSACPPGSPICQLLLRQLLSHSYALDSLSSKFQIVPSRTHDLHKPLRAAEFASACSLPIPALPNSHLRAGCQCLRCRIPRQPLFSSAYAPNEFSCLVWTFYR
jgi:hypothetical protein